MSNLTLKKQRYRAGLLSFELEDDGGLRNIRWGSDDVLMRVYAAVRDQDWGTVPAALSELSIKEDEDSFAISFVARHTQGPVDFQWKGEILGDSNGHLTYRFSGVANKPFLSNRIGFCVLHSMDCAGQRCVVTHSDGSVKEGIFPIKISPHQPFLDISAIRHAVRDNLWAELRFFGEIFEMEDQRNWTDASYKTYCTPLSLPFPRQIEAGQAIEQSVTLTVSGHTSDAAAKEMAPIRIAVDDSILTSLPAIGVEYLPSTFDQILPCLPTLRALNVAHIRVDLDLSDPNFGDALIEASALANLVGTSIEAAVFFSSASIENELRLLKLQSSDYLRYIKTWLVFQHESSVTDSKSFEQIKSVLTQLSQSSSVGVGTDYYFAELNRGAGRLPQSDLITYSINPQVHAFDDRSLFETLPAQKVTVEDALGMMLGCKVLVTPVTLKPRKNPNRTTAGDGVEGRDCDVRQKSQLNAAWTLGSVKYLSEGGASSVTLFEIVGPRGLFDETGTYPVYSVIHQINEFDPKSACPVTSSEPQSVIALNINRETKSRLLVANLTDIDQPVEISLGQSASVDKTDRVVSRVLTAYEVVTIDWNRGS